MPLPPRFWAVTHCWSCAVRSPAWERCRTHHRSCRYSLEPSDTQTPSNRCRTDPEHAPADPSSTRRLNHTQRDMLTSRTRSASERRGWGWSTCESQWVFDYTESGVCGFIAQPDLMSHLKEQIQRHQQLITHVKQTWEKQTCCIINVTL